jgi:hypothetical protein
MALAMALWQWLFGYGSLAVALWQWLFGYVSLDMALWLWLFGYGSLAMALWLWLFGYGFFYSSRAVLVILDLDTLGVETQPGSVANVAKTNKVRKLMTTLQGFLQKDISTID